jgi:hypothetical protein
MSSIINTRNTLQYAFAIVGLGGSVSLIATAPACSPPDKGVLERSVSTRASPGSFRANGVSTLIEKRCGSLDCHGSPARNMRIYSARGLRLPNDAGILPGTGDTTQDETTANYQSLLTVEPEATNKVIADNGDPYSLLIVKKPLEIEKHKGGAVIRRGDDAERCIVSWLKEDSLAPIDKGACTNAALFPKE